MAKSGIKLLMEVLQEELLSLKTDSYLIPEFEEVGEDFNDYYQERQKPKSNDFQLLWEGR